MVIKVYVSGISGNKEVKKRQQRVLLILDSKNVNYEVIDIAEPGAEDAKDFMQTNATSMGCTISDPSPRHPLPPQIFNDDVYCGDYDQFDMANEIDEMEKFLKLQVADATDNLISNAEIKLKNGEVTPDETEVSKDAAKETTSEVNENEVSEQESAVSEEKLKNEEVEEEAKSKDIDETSQEVKEDDDEAETVDKSEESKDQRAEAAGEQVDNEQDKDEAKDDEEVVAKNDEEKADA